MCRYTGSTARFIVLDYRSMRMLRCRVSFYLATSHIRLRQQPRSRFQRSPLFTRAIAFYLSPESPTLEVGTSVPTKRTKPALGLHFGKQSDASSSLWISQ